MKTLQEFCVFMDEFISKGPKLNLNIDTNKSLGPPSGLERSIGRKNLPHTIHGEKETTNYSSDYSGKDTQIYLNPKQLKTIFKRSNTDLSRGMETTMAHELGHHEDNMKKKMLPSFNRERNFIGRGQAPRAHKEIFKRELRAHKEGEALLAKHGRPPMDKSFKKASTASHHSNLLARRVDFDYQNNSTEQGRKAMKNYEKYITRTVKQGIALQKKGEEY